MINRVIPNKGAKILWHEDWFYTDPLLGDYILSKSISYSFSISQHWSNHLVLKVVKVCGKKGKLNKKYIELANLAFPNRGISKLKDQIIVRYEAKKWLCNELKIEIPKVEYCRACFKNEIKPWEGEGVCEKCLKDNPILE